MIRSNNALFVHLSLILIDFCYGLKNKIQSHVYNIYKAYSFAPFISKQTIKLFKKCLECQYTQQHVKYILTEIKVNYVIKKKPRMAHIYQ